MASKKRKVGIIAECVCDLPQSTLKRFCDDILYFLVETESGVFTDTDEITADNVFSHMEAGGKTISAPPSPEVYKALFEKNLKKYDDVILVAISSGISHSCENAEAALGLMDKDRERVHIFDSGHLSTGLGLFVLRACELANDDMGAEVILSELEKMKPLVSTSFLAKNADYLYKKGLVSLFVKNICSTFNIHPVLAMKNGYLRPRNIYLGNYDDACKNYIRRELKGRKNIDKNCAFITHAGCTVKMLRDITDEVNKYCQFRKLKVTNASATISSNCGPGTFGILYIRKEKGDSI